MVSPLSCRSRRPGLKGEQRSCRCAGIAPQSLAPRLRAAAPPLAHEPKLLSGGGFRRGKISSLWPRSRRLRHGTVGAPRHARQKR